jgi:NAD(P)H-hydrate epimerase
LFHAASKWSLDVASHFVDMLFYSSVPVTMSWLKKQGEFWNSINCQRRPESYLEEADCVLIGPGMDRSPETETLVNHLLAKYPTKKWVVDAGALQMVDPKFLTETCIITPHQAELELLETKTSLEQLLQQGVTILHKGAEDRYLHGFTEVVIPGGNPGMTKGGTGDVLAGLIAGLYATNTAEVAAWWAVIPIKSWRNTQHNRWSFNASELCLQVPKTLWEVDLCILQNRLYSGMYQPHFSITNNLLTYISISRQSYY